MRRTDKTIRRATTAVVVALAAVAAVVSYRHAFGVVTAYGETGVTAALVPLTVDGLIFAASLVLLDSARRGAPVPVLARWSLGLGIAATLAANVAHGWAHGPVGAIVAAWPAVALVLSYELLMGLIRRAAVPVEERVPEDVEASVAVPMSREVYDWAADQGAFPMAVPEGRDESPVNGVQPGTADVPTEGDRRPEGPAEPAASPAVTPVLGPVPDELCPVAADRYAEHLAQGAVPTLKTLKTDLKVGQPRAARIRTYLSQLAAGA